MNRIPLLLFAVVASSSPLALAQSASPGPAGPAGPAPAPAATGGLHRVSATLEAALDVHRLALVELVAASKKVLEVGSAPSANPKTQIPELAGEVFRRLAQSIPRRVSADALPAVTRGYHAEAVEALETLGRASTTADVAKPLRAYITAMHSVLENADQVIDLFSRARPIQTRVVDAGGALDDINEALDELGRAEAAVKRGAERRQPLGEQLQLFMRLEIALGHALDLIAEAQEAGIHIGFEVQRTTGSLDKVVKAVRAHLGVLEQSVSAMERPPQVLAGSLGVLIEAAADTPPYEAQLTFTAPEGKAQPAALRVYRQPNKEEAVVFLAAMMACELADKSSAQRVAEEQLAEFSGEETLVAEIPPGRGSHHETLGGAIRLIAAPIYRVVPVNAFGVEGEGLTAKAVFLPRQVEPPPLVEATLRSTDPAAPEFYREADLVHIRWQPSRNELPSALALADAKLSAWSKERTLPVVRGYRVLRVVGDRQVPVAVTRPEEHEATDRPSPEALAAGVSYFVETITDTGRAMQSPKPCQPSMIKSDLRPALELARLGVAYVRHPTAIEKLAETRLGQPGALEAARRAFAERPQGEQERLLGAFWGSLSKNERVAVLQKWPSFISEAHKDEWLLAGVDHLRTRDRSLVITETWLAGQPPYMQREIERWWNLLDAVTKKVAFENWRAHLNRGHRQWVDERLAAGDHAVLRPVQVIAWWNSRDADERERLLEWWLAVTPDERHRLYSDWLADQAPEVRLAVRWPDLEELTPSERDELLNRAPIDLPEGLWPRFLSWLDWQSLEGPALAEAVGREVSAYHRLLSMAQYALRPFDRAVGFHGVLAVLGSIVALSTAGVLVKSRRRRLSAPREGSRKL